MISRVSSVEWSVIVKHLGQWVGEDRGRLVETNLVFGKVGRGFRVDPTRISVPLPASQQQICEF